MAVAIEFFNVIVRKSAVERSFPGGLDGFARQELSNLTEDDHLFRVGFMASNEAMEFVSELEGVGLRFLGADADSDIALIVWDDSPIPPWLSVGDVDGHRACWQSDAPPGELIWAEPGFLLRCPRSLYRRLDEVVRLCGVELVAIASEGESALIGAFRCVRGEAEILLEIIGNRDGDASVGLWGQRQLARRRMVPSDAALIRDLVAILVQNGAENPGGSTPRDQPS